MYIIGKDTSDIRSSFLIGKDSTTGKNVYFDITFPHVMLICGKRGTGKSYSLGVFAEGLLDKGQLVLIVDTMNIYWTMFRENRLAKNEELSEFNLVPKGVPINIISIKHDDDFYQDLQTESELVKISKLELKPSELSPAEWCDLFELNINEPMGMALFTAVSLLADDGEFDLDDIVKKLTNKDIPIGTQKALSRRLQNLKLWGLFGSKGLELSAILDKRRINILDLGMIPRGEGNGMRSVVLTIIARKIMNDRINIRKFEELSDLSDQPFLYATKIKKGISPIWLLIDEAHQFIPRKGVPISKPALITWAKEGRQPGLGLILATQRPGAIDPDILSQCDIIVGHRVTLHQDLRALNELSQNYMTSELKDAIGSISGRGMAVIMDDVTEQLLRCKVRPRLTWHGGGERKLDL